MSGHVLPRLFEDNSAHDGFAESETGCDSRLQFAGGGTQPNHSDDVFGGSGGSVTFASGRALGLGVLAVARSPWSTIRQSARPVVIPSRPTLGMKTRSVTAPATGPLASLSVPVVVVVLLGSDLEVSRVYTRGVVALVQYVRSPRGNRAVRENPSQSVRPNLLSVEPDQSVSSPIPRAGPHPTGAEARCVNENGSVSVNLLPEIIWCILSHSSVEPPCPRFRGQGRSGVTSTLAVRLFYHHSAENLSKSTKKAA